jgi:hypothetical protein
MFGFSDFAIVDLRYMKLAQISYDNLTVRRPIIQYLARFFAPLSGGCRCQLTNPARRARRLTSGHRKQVKKMCAWLR